MTKSVFGGVPPGKIQTDLRSFRSYLETWIVCITFIVFTTFDYSDGFVSSKIYDKRDDFVFDIVNFPFLDEDIPTALSNGVYISQLIRFVRVFSHVADFNARNKKI